MYLGGGWGGGAEKTDRVVGRRRTAYVHASGGALAASKTNGGEPHQDGLPVTHVCTTSYACRCTAPGSHSRVARSEGKFFSLRFRNNIVTGVPARRTAAVTDKRFFLPPQRRPPYVPRAYTAALYFSFRPAPGFAAGHRISCRTRRCRINTTSAQKI